MQGNRRKRRKKRSFIKRYLPLITLVVLALLLIGIVIALISLLLSLGGDGQEPMETAGVMDTVPSEPTSPPIDEPTEEESDVTETDPDETKEPSTTLSMEQILALSNERNDHWFGNTLDENNRPTHIVDCQKIWGKYDADFYVPTEEKVLYLTFDCGFENGYTSKILDALKQSGVKAVFFITMDYAKSSPDLVRRMISEGHVVGNHSLTHPAKGMVSLTIEKQIEDVMVLHDYVKEQFGYSMYLFRYPAGIYSDQSLALLQSLGYRSVFWSYALYDYDVNDQPDPDQTLTKLINRLHGGGIYLLHAISSTNAQILPDFIQQARDLGYTFVTYGK